MYTLPKRKEVKITFFSLISTLTGDLKANALCRRKFLRITNNITDTSPTADTETFSPYIPCTNPSLEKIPTA